MRRRAASIAALSIAFALLVTPQAFGWGNGPPTNGNNPPNGNGYGTHDWALEHAITLAGAGASWVDVGTALRASDDPDYGSTKTSGIKHAYMGTGYVQGGPQAIADEYYKLMQAYQAGNYQEASRLLGTLSHYYTDIVQPYHTDPRGSTEVNSRHEAYERKVSDWQTTYGSRAAWIRPSARTSVTDIRQRAVSASLYARSKYAGIDSSFRSGNLAAGTYAYDSTGYVLNKAVNDLADIIQAVPRGEGLAKAPAVLKQNMQKMPYHYPRRSTSSAAAIRTQVYAYGADGKPMRGLAVTFSWPLATGMKSVVAYTDGNGLAYNWQAPGTSISLMQKRTVTAKTVQSNVEVQSSTWYVPSPVLAYSTPGMKTSVSNTRPKRGTTVKSWTRVRDTAGKPVVGLPVTFSWHFKSTTVKVTALTNSNGYAYSSKYISPKTAKGYRIYVKARTYSGRQTRNSAASFVPQ